MEVGAGFLMWFSEPVPACCRERAGTGGSTEDGERQWLRMLTDAFIQCNRMGKLAITHIFSLKITVLR